MMLMMSGLTVGQVDSEGVDTAYINVARYQPQPGGTYFPLPPKLKTKKAIVNVQNKDNECLK